MYGGDEVSAIVLDLGSHTCKAGYAGEDAPKAVFPSVVGSIDQTGVLDAVKTERDSGPLSDPKNGVGPFDSDKPKAKRKLYVGSQALGYRRDHMEVLSPMKDGVVVDWDIVDNIWDHAFRECLLIDPTEHPMLLAEPSSNTPQQRERTAELMFEKYKVPALFLAKNAVLTSFASGRATSLVVDSGGGSTTVAAVHDGYVLQKESPQAARVKVLASGNAIERRFSVWIGGSILASLGSFQQMWFSKAEYEEHGVSYIQRKCP